MRAALAMTILAAGCALPALDLAEKGCPCVSGYTCDAVRDVCIADGTEPTDASTAGESGAADGDAAIPSDGGDAPPGEAGENDANGLDAAPPPFCSTLAPAPTFCADFDTADLPSGFTQASSWSPFGHISRSGTDAKSGPFAALCDVDPLTGTTAQSASFLAKVMPSPIAASLTITFDVSLELMDTTNEVMLAYVEVIDPGAKDRVQLGVQKGRTRIVEEAVPSDGGATQYAGNNLSPQYLPSGGGWAHVVWTLARAATSATSSITITGGGLTAGTGDFSNIRLYQYKSAPKVVVGIPVVTAPSTRWRVRMDNVILDMK